MLGWFKRPARRELCVAVVICFLYFDNRQNQVEVNPGILP